MQDSVGTIRALSAKPGVTAIIVFDQLDDYLVQHRERFISRSGRVISSEKLRKSNRFWNELAGLVSEGSTHCVFVSRQDLQWGRGSLRLHDRDEDCNLNYAHNQPSERWSRSADTARS